MSMNYDFEKAINKILDKVFKKAISTGYDAEQVDSFFDEVIEYIKQVRQLQKTLSAQLQVKDQQIAKLHGQIKQLEDKCHQLEDDIEEYRKNGYSTLRSNNH